MKIISVHPCISQIIRVDSPKDDYTTYRRHSKDNWELLMSESWETYYFCEEVEQAYQTWLEQFNGQDQSKVSETSLPEENAGEIRDVSQ